MSSSSLCQWIAVYYQLYSPKRPGKKEEERAGVEARSTPTSCPSWSHWHPDATSANVTQCKRWSGLSGSWKKDEVLTVRVTEDFCHREQARLWGAENEEKTMEKIRPGFKIFREFIGCPRIIRTCSFSRFSPLRWNRWCCGFQNFQNYSSRVKAKRHTLPKSAYYSVQSLDQVSIGESFFPFCSKTKQATRYWQEAQLRLPQQTHWHDICWRA